MNSLTNKIDFVLLLHATNANPNGDPLDDNRPRTDYNGYGEISDVCIKRKIRNRMQDKGQAIFVQSDDRCDDGFSSLSDRASAVMKGIKDRTEYAHLACEKWVDVRTFGQVFAFKAKSKKGGEDEEKPTPVGVRGPVSIHQAISISPVEVQSIQITKSVNGEPSAKRSSDTMGQKHFVRFGLYEVKGSINVQLAQKTGFSAEDANLVRECLLTLFENDASSARPEGSMEVYKLYWFEHTCASGQYSAAQVHRSLHVTLKDGVDVPSGIQDYEITREELPGLKCTEYDGV